jgi:hypothetical protein
MNKTSNLNFVLGLYGIWGKKKLFCPNLFYKFHHRKNLISLFFRTFVFRSYLQSQNFEIMGPRGTSYTNSDFTTVDILLFFSPETGESAQLRFALNNFGRISSDLGEFRPFCSRIICCFGEISPKSKEIGPKFWGRNLTARIRPFRARKIITVYNVKMKTLFSEFHQRTNLTEPLLNNLGSKNKTTNSEF